MDERDGIAGDWNQALMELGSQVCKPVAPDCGGCPLKVACKAYAEVRRLSVNTSHGHGLNGPGQVSMFSDAVGGVGLIASCRPPLQSQQPTPQAEARLLARYACRYHGPVPRRVEMPKRGYRQ